MNNAQIKQALKEAEAKGRLSIVAAVIGVDEKWLRKIINGEVELNVAHRLRY